VDVSNFGGHQLIQQQDEIASAVYLLRHERDALSNEALGVARYQAICIVLEMLEETRIACVQEDRRRSAPNRPKGE
jgi:hypothetical protein